MRSTASSASTAAASCLRNTRGRSDPRVCARRGCVSVRKNGKSIVDMKILITGSSGHLGEALVRTLRARHDVVGLDVTPSPCTSVIGSIADADAVRAAMADVDAVLHTATLHKR